MKKKLLSALLSVAMVATMLVGCGGGAATETAGEASGEAGSLAYSGNISMMHFSTSEESEGNGGSDGFRTCIANWKEANPNITLDETVLANGDYKTQIATMAAALINIVLNYFCIQKYGYIAAGYTTLFSYLALAVFHYGISRRLEPEKIFNWKYDAALSAIVILACLSSMFVYKINLLRYFTVLLLFVIVIVRRKKYISALGEMRV